MSGRDEARKRCACGEVDMTGTSLVFVKGREAPHTRTHCDGLAAEAGRLLERIEADVYRVQSAPIDLNEIPTAAEVALNGAAYYRKEDRVVMVEDGPARDLLFEECPHDPRFEYRNECPACLIAALAAAERRGAEAARAEWDATRPKEIAPKVLACPVCHWATDVCIHLGERLAASPSEREG